MAQALILLVCIISILSLRAAEAVSMHGLHVVGKNILNSAGQAVLLHGINRSGTEYQCNKKYGEISDGPGADANSIKRWREWHVNAIRVPMNSDCWLGYGGPPAATSGSHYKAWIKNYVDELTNAGFAVILDLHWTAPGNMLANEQIPMPDKDHAPAFWREVATEFKGHSNVLFDLFNEPYPGNSASSTNAYDGDFAWNCWKNGCHLDVPGNSNLHHYDYDAVGMQSLVDTVRATGATNIVMVGGIAYSNSLKQWLTYKPNDPKGQLACSMHNYDFNVCNNEALWESDMVPVLEQVPLIVGEFGAQHCGTSYATQLLPWLDAHNVHYLAWAWNTWGCDNIALIDNWNGAPTLYGAPIKSHYATAKTSFKATGSAPSPTHAPTPAPHTSGTSGSGSGSGSGGHGAPSAPGGRYLYEDKFFPSKFGWENWSWGTKFDASTTSPAPHNGKYCLAAHINGWGAVKFGTHHAVAKTSYQTISFWARAAGTVSSLKIYWNGQENEGENVGHIGSSWKQYHFAIAHGAHVPAKLETITIKNEKKTAVTVYFDDIQFTVSASVHNDDAYAHAPAHPAHPPAKHTPTHKKPAHKAPAHKAPAHKKPAHKEPAHSHKKH